MLKRCTYGISLALALAGAAACASAPRTAPAATSSSPSADPQLVDDVAAARARLEQERAALRAGRPQALGARLQRMVELGMWGEAEALAAGAGDAAAVRLATAELRLRQHRYEDARRLVAAVLAAEPANRAARLLDARLEVQAWRLDRAAAIAQALLDARPQDEDAALLLGRIHLLEKRYADALAWAERVQQWNAGSAAAHLLEADVRFWDQDPAGAEPSLVRALALDPFDPDARFSYGYAIWRRVDATQLDAMAAQWNLALEVDPLHYVTHWHWGNGHTNLTYADYAMPSDSAVRVRLAPADSLIAARRVDDAIALARRVERDSPESVLPAMLRASAFYMAWETDRGARLDSAQATFQSILARKPNYGPAHNGLAAIIKQRQFTVLAAFDSLEAEIGRTPLPADARFDSVFPDARYYPGDRVARMVRLELGPSLAYLPLIARQDRRYRIPPLHVDLAQAMARPFFRTSTTFDNRQWMDIRGVGSGAAAIEYVERGAHQERKVLLHEYVHLFHGIVFTDAENRRVRQLYHDAMRERRTLDYYASNNESEFLAQAYPAFLSPVKVHPLNHKAMNTHDDLRSKDPATYAFVDSLIARQRAALAGDTAALASNWAQVYVNLSEQARQAAPAAAVPAAQQTRRAAVLLDSALAWDAAYLPALLSYAALERDAGRYAQAEAWLARAERLDARYAPIFRARAELVAARGRAGGGNAAATLERQVALYQQALALEADLSERAGLNRALRELLFAEGRLPDAIRVAEAYVAEAPTISTYLRDRRDEAAAFAHQLRAEAGYAGETLAFFRELAAQKPQNWTVRGQYADALVAAGELDEAAATLDDAQRILSAGGTPDVGFAARLAQIRLLQGDTAAARAALTAVPVDAARGEGAGRGGRAPRDGVGLRLARVHAALGEAAEAERRLAAAASPATARERAEHAFTRGVVAARAGNVAAAERALRDAIAADAYHRAARVQLVALLRAAGRGDEAAAVAQAASTLALPLGPDFQREAAAAAAPAG